MAPQAKRRIGVRELVRIVFVEQLLGLVILVVFLVLVLVEQRYVVELLELVERLLGRRRQLGRRRLERQLLSLSTMHWSRRW